MKYLPTAEINTQVKKCVLTGTVRLCTVTEPINHILHILHAVPIIMSSCR